MRFIALCLISALITTQGACVHRGEVRPARPAKGTPRVVGAPRATYSEVASIYLRVNAAAWKGTPTNLTRAVVPLSVFIDNRSAHPLRVRYADIVFRGPGLDYFPLPPRKLVDRSVTEQADPIRVPKVVGTGFRVPLAHYPNAPRDLFWELPWEAQADFYMRQYAKWTVTLPTLDMIDRALPEGVLDPGGHVEGFLYFEHFRSDARKVDLTFELVDAKSAVAFGTITLPFAH